MCITHSDALTPALYYLPPSPLSSLLLPYQSSPHTNGFFCFVCVSLALTRTICEALRLNYPLESGGYISDYKTESCDSLSPAIHQWPAISNNGQKPTSLSPVHD